MKMSRRQLSACPPESFTLERGNVLFEIKGTVRASWFV